MLLTTLFMKYGMPSPGRPIRVLCNIVFLTSLRPGLWQVRSTRRTINNNVQQKRNHCEGETLSEKESNYTVKSRKLAVQLRNVTANE